METSLLKTKLDIPPLRARWIDRANLLEYLGQYSDFDLVLVSAPAGFGKTTILSQWAHQLSSNSRVAWLSLDLNDDAPERYWYYFIHALKTQLPGMGDVSLGLLKSGRPMTAQALLIPLINELAGISKDLILILDDHHLVRSNQIYDGLTYFLENMPPNIHLVIVSRKDLSLPLARFRARGILLEIRSDDLRFNVEEATNLFNILGTRALSEENIKALTQKTEGWAVGLTMVASSLNNQTDPSRFVSEFTGTQRYIMDYLMEEVLIQQTPTIREFLLKTSVLDKLNGSLCDAVTGRSDGQEILADLENANLFLVPLDGTRQWFRYEHLFSEMLRHNLEIEYNHDSIVTLHMLASNWYETHGLLEQALFHTLAVNDWEKALSIISDPKLKESTWRSWTAFNWLSAIPIEELCKNSIAYLDYLWALEWVGQYEEAEKLIENFGNLVSIDDLPSGSLAALRATIAADKGDIITLKQNAKEAFSLVPEGNVAIQALASSLLEMNYVFTDLLQEAGPRLTQAYETFNRQRNNSSDFPLSLIGLIAFFRGDLEKAEHIFQGIVKHNSNDSFSRASAFLLLGMIYYEWNRIDDGIRVEENAIGLLKGTQNRGLDRAYLYLFAMKLAIGAVSEAAELLELASDAVYAGGSLFFDRARLAAFQVVMAIANNDHTQVEGSVEALASYEEYLPLDAPVFSIRALYARKGESYAIAKFQEKYDRFKDSGLFLLSTLTRLSQALLTSDPVISLRYLSQVLTMARPMGLKRPFIDEGMPLVPLLEQAINAGTEKEYATELLSLIRSEDNNRRAALANLTRPQINLLSERELEVLHLVAQGISNYRIADRLNISLATAKTHVHHIIDKLEVRDRSQAVYRARELNLL